MSLYHRTYLFPTRAISSFTRKSSALKNISSSFASSSSSTQPASSTYSISQSSPRTTTPLCSQVGSSRMRMRRYTSASASSASARTVDLVFSAVAPASSSPTDNGLRDTLVLHGLFGSGNNWRNMAKRLSDSSQSNIYLMDQRNHGSSPHSDEVNYEIMAEDVRAFINKNSLKDVSIIGHSMGGKVAMVLALKYPDLIKRLLVVDMAPYSLENAQKTFNGFSAAMLDLDFSKITTRKQADEALQAAVPDMGVRQFLLTNLTVGGDKLSWKSNIQVIHDSMDKFMDFPKLDATYTKPTLFVGGKNSNYISEKQLPSINKFFPSSEVIHLEGAGHWVHAERPEDFLRVATEFLNK